MKVLIVYGSTLGKTQRVAKYISASLTSNNLEVTTKDVRETTVKELYNYDLVVFGCSTWDDGMLQFDFRKLYKEFILSSFPQRNFAIFILGSEKYPHPFGSAQILEKAVSDVHGTLVVPILKLDIDHDDKEDKCDEEINVWISNLVENL